MPRYAVALIITTHADNPDEAYDRVTDAIERARLGELDVPIDDEYAKDAQEIPEHASDFEVPEIRFGLRQDPDCSCASCVLERKERLEYLRQELRAERISYGELIELQGLAKFIEPGDVELLEAAGVPEHEETSENA